MSLGPVILDIKGLELTIEEREVLRHPQVGGIILFTRNYNSPDQLENLIQQIRAATKQRLLITVDHEGGRVQRFREGFFQLPALAKIGALHTSNPVLAKQLAQQHAWLMATELLAFDIDLSFAPVLDVNNNISQVIGDRSFHIEPNVIAELGRSYIQGLTQAGMAAVGKHFPGHGSVAADSHTDIPIDTRDYQTIANSDLIPFAALGQELTGIMPAHIIYPEVDTVPAGFSKHWLQKILRTELKFDGAIFSDDLTMAGAHVVGDITERAHLALQAGCDSLLICNDAASAITVLEKLERHNFKLNSLQQLRLEKLLGKPTLNRHELAKHVLWKQAVNNLNQLGEINDAII